MKINGIEAVYGDFLTLKGGSEVQVLRNMWEDRILVRFRGTNCRQVCYVGPEHVLSNHNEILKRQRQWWRE